MVQYLQFYYISSLWSKLAAWYCFASYIFALNDLGALLKGNLVVDSSLSFAFNRFCSMIGTGWDSLGQTGIAWVCSDKTSFHSLFLTAGRFHSFFTIHMLALRQQMLVSDPGSVVFFGHEVGRDHKLHEVLQLHYRCVISKVLFLPRRLLAGTSCGPRWCSISLWRLQEQGEIRNGVSSRYWGCKSTSFGPFNLLYLFAVHLQTDDHWSLFLKLADRYPYLRSLGVMNQICCINSWEIHWVRRGLKKNNFQFAETGNRERGNWHTVLTSLQGPMKR